MKKFNLLDILIILVIIVVGVVGVKVLLKASGSGDMKGEETSKVVFTVEQSSSPKEVVDAVKVGDIVGIGVNQIDTCVVTDVSYVPAEEYAFDGIGGEYKKVEIPERYKLKVTCEGQATVTDMEISCGQTEVRVGKWFGLRGKGYAVTGYIIESDLVG